MRDDEFIAKQDAVEAVAFGITYASAFNRETGERIDLFAKENEELQKAIERINGLSSANVVPVETLQAKISELKYQLDCYTPHIEYYNGYTSALHSIELILAAMREE